VRARSPDQADVSVTLPGATRRRIRRLPSQVRSTIEPTTRAYRLAVILAIGVGVDGVLLAQAVQAAAIDAQPFGGRSHAPPVAVMPR
jgi:hypothetical protein